MVKRMSEGRVGARALGAAMVSVLLVLPGCGHRGAVPSTVTPDPAPPVAATSPSVVFGQVAPPFQQPPVLAGMPDIAALADKVKPTVVNITTSSSALVPRMLDPFEFFFGPDWPHSGPRLPPNRMERRALGTGFIVDPAGYVVTNAHVVEDAEDVSVKLSDDRTFKATVVGRDERLDIALLKLEGAQGLPAVVMGDSDALRVGEYVVAVGNPFGLGHTVTMGIVSAKDRTIGAGPYDDFIQTDASINPGNSGGPLFDLRGAVVGINTAIHAQGQGIGFAIPINQVRDSVQQLRATGRVERGKLGLVFQPVTDEIAKAMGLDRPYGALVAEVEPDGPAAKAGIQPGDLITSVNGEQITQGSQLARMIARNAPGSTVRLTWRRQGQEKSGTATLAALESDDKGIGKASPSRPDAKPTLGFGLSMTPAAGGGVLVTEVRGQAAGKIQPRDIILAVDGQTVSSPPEVVQALTRASTQNRPALIRIKRGGRVLFVVLDPRG